MLKHFIIEASSDGDLDLDVFDSHEAASMFINDRAVEIYNMWLEEYDETDLEIWVKPSYARVSIVLPGQEFDRILEYKPLEV